MLVRQSKANVFGRSLIVFCPTNRHSANASGFLSIVNFLTIEQFKRLKTFTCLFCNLAYLLQ